MTMQEMDDVLGEYRGSFLSPSTHNHALSTTSEPSGSIVVDASVVSSPSPICHTKDLIYAFKTESVVDLPTLILGRSNNPLKRELQTGGIMAS